MQLKLGKMTSKELAEWFGCSYGNFRNIKKKKLEELKNFANFEEIYGGVLIKEIKYAEYEKQAIKNRTLLQKVFLEEWDNEKHNNLNTCANVAKKISQKYGSELNLKESSIENYSRQIRKRDFGVPYFIDGEKGSCGYLWAKAIPIEGNDNIYVCEKLTDEEIKIKNELLEKYFATKNAGDIEKKIIIDDMVNCGEISKEDAYDLYKNIDGLNELKFQEYLIELKAKLGCKIIKTTELYIGKYLQAEKREERLILKEGEFNFNDSNE